MSAVTAQQGFLLTRQQRDSSDGIELTYWLAHPDGAFPVCIPGQEAVLFIHRSQVDQVRQQLANLTGWRVADVPLQDLQQQPVSALYCRSLRVLRDVIERLSQAAIIMMEEDIRHCDRYLMERFVQGGVELLSQGQQVKLKPAEIKPSFKVLSIDIETNMRASKIHSIALYADDFQLVFMRGEGQSDQRLRFLPDEKALLWALIDAVKRYDPDIFIGWNVVGFDFRVLAERARLLGVPLKLGRAGDLLTVNQAGNGMWFARMTGRIVLDGIDTLKGATWQFESFSLEYVSRQLLERGKLIDKVEGRGGSIQKMFREDKQALARYNLEDCKLVWDIFEKAQLLHYLIERAQLTGLALDKVGGSQAAFDNQYLPLLHRQGYVAPEYASGQSGLSAPGGYVMDSKPGLYSHVLVLDFKSLYPSIIQTFKVDPMGLSEGTRQGAAEADLIPGFNHAIFSRSRHILPGLIDQLWQARDRAKQAQNASLSQAIKIIMNSFYGVLGSNVCRFFDQRLSSSITLRGHEILTRTRDEIEGRFGYQVIYGDTDSVFVWLGDECADEDTDAKGAQLAQHLNQWWQQQLQKRFQLPSQLEIEYETHYSRFLMPTMRHSDKGTKKRYAGLQRFADGSHKMVFKGLENVRTDWSAVARELQEKLYERVFLGQPWQQLIKDTVADVREGRCDEQLVYRRRLRQPVEAYQRNRPPHAQAADKAQQFAKRAGVPAPYQVGDYVHYVMTVNGAEPVEYQQSPIDYQHYIDKQIQPVADTILHFLGEEFEALVAPQIGLF